MSRCDVRFGFLGVRGLRAVELWMWSFALLTYVWVLAGEGSTLVSPVICKADFSPFVELLAFTKGIISIVVL